jgi:hypothetical protein
MNAAARAVLRFGLPILVCLLIYWKGLTAWFLMDDYAWLGLRDEVHSFPDLLTVLFRPQAQGTVRVFSERAFFLIFSSLFGIEALPFKLWIFLTQFANLALISILTLRLTGSQIAAVAAPILWTMQLALVVPLSWASAYNQILWSFCLLSVVVAFTRYCDTGRRRWLFLCWIVYLAGFGVLELNVVLPAVLLLYTLSCARGHWRATLPFFIPAAIFTYIHTALVPKTPDPIYRMYFDSSLIGTFWHYLVLALSPTRLTGIAVALLITAWIVARMLRRDGAPLFLAGWFILVLAPVLPLREHVVEYYLTAPTIAVGIACSAALAAAWHFSRPAGIAAAAVLAACAVAMHAEIDSALTWRHENSIRLRNLLFAVEQSYENDPKPVLLLSGVDHRLYSAGFNDYPFRLFAPVKVYVTPGSESELKQERYALRGVDEYVISDADAARALERKEALVLHVEDDHIRNITARYTAIARARTRPVEQRRIDVGLPGSEEKLGPTWHPIERGFRWMPQTASVRLAGPDSADSELRIEGFAPAAAVQDGPVQLMIKIDGLQAGLVRVSRPDERFSHTVSIPPRLVGKTAITIELSLDRTLQSPDGRRLGLIFGVFEIKNR